MDERVFQFRQDVANGQGRQVHGYGQVSVEGGAVVSRGGRHGLDLSGPLLIAVFSLIGLCKLLGSIELGHPVDWVQ